jgi:CRISPR-associated protein Cmr6
MNNQAESPTYRHKLEKIYKHITGQSAGAKLLDDKKGIHAGLWLDKYIGGQDKKDTESRRTLVEQVSLIPIPTTYRQFYERWQKVLDKEYNARFRYGNVKGRMVVGLGDESVLETSVALHRTYGVPYIPGSALKGSAAHYANLRAGENSRWKKGGDLYNFVFGTTEGEGSILFFDAFYMPDTGHKGKPLYPDVITVHHREYYQGQDPKKAPADWDSPTPIPFLSATGKYLIALAAPEVPQAEQWIEGVFAILESALAEMGIGAKTSSGYGRMILELPEKDKTASRGKSQAEQEDPDKKKAERLILEINRLMPNGIAGQMPNYQREWQKLTSAQYRRIVAQSMIDKVRQLRRDKDFAEKTWYKELRTFLDTF